MLPSPPRADLICGHAECTFGIFQTLVNPVPLALHLQEVRSAVLRFAIIAYGIFPVSAITMLAHDQAFGASVSFQAVPGLDHGDGDLPSLLALGAFSERDGLPRSIRTRLDTLSDQDAGPVNLIARGRAPFP